MLYDVQTADPKLGKNELSQQLEGLRLVAGKAYTIKIVVGMESVKVTAEMTSWEDDGTAEVDLPELSNSVTQTTSAGMNDYEYHEYTEE